ncbi:MAG: MBL fold metallo-hydrolase, partial [Candidatus Paceibacterota bacterium]
GKIYSTPPTKEITKIMLDDTGGILEKDTEHNLDKIYSLQNIDKAIELWEVFPYHKQVNITDNLSFIFRDTGHILGSMMIEFTYNGKKIVFTGDLGNSPSPILPNTEDLKDIDYLIMESVYGDRNHETRNERRERLEEVIEDNVKRKGVLMIPTFSLERSQELLFEINSLMENNRIPLVSFYFDSPLAIRLTEVYQRYKDYFNETAKKLIESGDDIFKFSGLKSTLQSDQSKLILSAPKPKIIIAGSGMSSGGRITHHEKNYLPDPNNILLLTGYQSFGTLGRKILDGAKKVYIYGEEVPVRAKIVVIDGYSGHKDSDGLVNFVQNIANSVKKVFVVMGEPRSSLFLAQKLKDGLGIDAYPPEAGEVVELEC